jgi:hypothetical protein
MRDSIAARRVGARSLHMTDSAGSPRSSPPRRPHTRHVALTIVLSLVGVALLVWQIQKVGASTVINQLVQVGWGFGVILAISLARFALRSAAWGVFIGPDAPFAGLLAATIAGDAIGNLTPFSLVVSEPAKSIYLRDVVPVSRSFAALTAENFFYSISVATFIIIGTVVLLESFVLPYDVPWLRSAALAAIAAMTAALMAAAWIAWQRPAVASQTLRWIPGINAASLVERVRAFESTTYAFVHQRGAKLGIVIASEIAFHVLSFLESYYTLWLLTGRASALAALVLDTFNRVVNVAFRAVPLRVGVDEYGTGLLASVVGFTSATGVALALVRKGRVLVWAGAGLVLMLSRGMTLKQALGS